MTDEQKSGVRQPVKHHMGRRCFNWDYTSRCIYMITITLADRSQPILGRLWRKRQEPVLKHQLYFRRRLSYDR